LLIQSQFGIGHSCRVLAAAGQQRDENDHQKNGRWQSQMTIMSCSAAFENPGVTPLPHAG
jgi:hypothetical protein